MNNFPEVKQKLGKPYFDLEFLLNCLAEVLEENNEDELVPYIPWINESKDFGKDISIKKILHRLLRLLEQYPMLKAMYTKPLSLAARYGWLRI